MGPILKSDRQHLLGVALRVTGARADAEDAVHGALVRFLERGADVPSGVDRRRWLTTIVKRAAVDVVRHRQRRAETPYSDHDMQVYVALVDEPEAQRNMTATDMDAALHGCSAVIQETFWLWFSQRLSSQAIADRQQISVATVRTRLHRARRWLRSAFPKRPDFDF